jgi:hypothetical protein
MLLVSLLFEGLFWLGGAALVYFVGGLSSWHLSQMGPRDRCAILWATP